MLFSSFVVVSHCYWGGAKSFPNYYKRRIARIYPTVLAVALFTAMVLSLNAKILDDFILGGGWFVQCIMIYYVPLYFIHRYFMGHFNWLWVITGLVVLVTYYTIFQCEWNGSIFMYGETKFKWVFNFLFMLYGGYVGSHHERFKYHWKSVPMLVICVMAWYSFFFMSKYSEIIVNLQYLSIIPLFGIIHYFYILCNHSFLEKMAKSRISGQIIFVVGGLCLETYLIQTYLFTDRLNWMFPLNIPMVMLFVLVVAYIVNFFANLISQTFKSEDYDYKRLYLHR